MSDVDRMGRPKYFGPDAPVPSKVKHLTRSTLIEEASLPRRAINVLLNEGLETLGDVIDYIQVQLDADKKTPPILPLLRVPNCGRLSANQIMAVIAKIPKPRPLEVPAPDAGSVAYIAWCWRNRDLLEPLMRLEPPERDDKL